MPSLNDSDFVFGRNSCINRNFLNFFVKLLIAHCVKLKTCNCDVTVIENTNLLCDCTCCDFVATTQEELGLYMAGAKRDEVKA